MGERPLVGVGVIVIRDNKILMGKRKNAHGDGTWSFPGGHLEFNEDLEAAAKREVLEETGIRIKNIKIGTFTNDIFEKEGKHYITLFLLSEHDSGEPEIMEPDSCDEWRWVEWESMPQPLFIPIENLLKQNFNPFNF